jgi:cellulose synthase/poly-beta-1,6-N-acetylglucosamine synthase-like glycosyltransferase
LIDAAAVGLLPLNADGQLVWVIAPRNFAARTVTRLLGENPQLAARIRLTSGANLDRFIARNTRRALGARAADALRLRWPQLSAAPRDWRISPWAAITATALPALVIVFPEQTLVTVQAVLAVCFMAWLTLRVLGSLVEAAPPKRARISDRALPVYTILVALYREATCVHELVASLRRLDYPPEKLDIKFVTELDDLETGIALVRLDLGPPFELIVAPAGEPRTKPKALNAALPFARGTFTVIYDAEDRPEPDQLRRALDVFLEQGDELACVQARLTIDNTSDSWLSRLFTAEYSAQFDLFLPGLAALDLPLPLGGSSNHFRTAVLREVGGWDPYNVTEDADLGMRLARFGYCTSVIASTTYEEAPARLAPWMCQRTRWFKGWMRTWQVHMRSPLRLLRELGPAGFASFQLVVGGNALAALVHPLYLASILLALALGWPMFKTGDLAATVFFYFCIAAVAAGYLVSMVLSILGLARRGQLAAAWALVLLPIHWMLLSAAAWRALYQLMREPSRWEKTEHGLGRSSRLAQMNSASVLGAVFARETEEPHWRREAAE